MSWYTKARSLVVKFGPAAGTAMKHIAALVPGGAVVGDLVEAAVKLTADAGKEQIEAETALKHLATAEELNRLATVFDLCMTKLERLVETVRSHEGESDDAIERLIAAQLAADQQMREGFALLTQEVRHFERIESKVDEVKDELERLRRELREWCEKNRVPAGPRVDPLIISVSSAAEREKLRTFRDRLRAVPEGATAADDWLKLGDGLAAAGLFDDAGASHEKAAGKAHERGDADREAEASFKAFRDRCERGEWAEALGHLKSAAARDPGRYEPFPLRRYEPVRILGAGGFGTVFLCHDRNRRNMEVAVKALHVADLDRPLDDVFAEGQTLDELKHPNIIAVRDWDQHHHRPYLVMEYFAGTSLEEHVIRHGKLEAADALAVALQVADAMRAAHAAGVLHRDLKPANVLVRREGGWQVKLIDLGLAIRQSAVQTSVAVEANKRTRRDASFAGTYEYAAPEQRGKVPGAEVGPWSDVYGFGKTFLRALLGTTEPDVDEWQGLPPPWREALRRCVSRRKEQRFTGFAEVIEALTPATESRKPGEVFVLTVRIPEPARKPGEVLALQWKGVPDRGRPA